MPTTDLSGYVTAARERDPNAVIWYSTKPGAPGNDAADWSTDSLDVILSALDVLRMRQNTPGSHRRMYVFVEAVSRISGPAWGALGEISWKGRNEDIVVTSS